MNVWVFLQYNYTALHVAAKYGCNNIISALISYGAKVNVVDDVSYE